MVSFVKWTIRGNMYCAVVKHSSYDREFRAMWSKKTERLYVSIPMNDLVFIDVKKAFVCLCSTYIDGKCKLGQPKSIAWG